MCSRIRSQTSIADLEEDARLRVSHYSRALCIKNMFTFLTVCSLMICFEGLHVYC